MSDNQEEGPHYTNVRVLVITDNPDKPRSIVSATLDDSEAGDLFSLLGMICPPGDVTPRTRKMLKWCEEHKMKPIPHSSVTQIIVKFEDIEESLHLIE